MQRTYKFRLYPSKIQQKEINTHLWLSKNLWNELLEHCKQIYNDFGLFPTKNTLQQMVKNYGMYSQTQQEIAHRVSNSVWRFINLKKKGFKCGFPRFKSINRIKSLHYPQYKTGFWLNNKLKVTPFGEISIKKHRKIKGIIKTLSIKKEASGKWFAIFSVEQEAPVPKINHGGKVGIDLGLMNLMTLSDGTVIKNPHHLKKHEERLKWYQRRLSKKKKRSRYCKGKNRNKAKIMVARVYERVKTTRLDFCHKTVNNLLSKYSVLVFEDLNIKEMAHKKKSKNNKYENHGKNINDAGWNILTNITLYKAEETGSVVVFVDPKNTSKICSNCGELVDKNLWDRTHDCPHCGLSMNRDLNASINILKRATVGQTGSNACGDETIVSSMKQEARTL